MNKAYLFA